MYKKYLQGFFCPSHSTLRSSPAPTNTRLVSLGGRFGTTLVTPRRVENLRLDAKQHFLFYCRSFVNISSSFFFI